MTKNNHKRWKVVYGYGDAVGVTFVIAVDDVEAHRKVREDVERKMGTSQVVIYNVSEDKKTDFEH
jgi:hypothetical protein